MCGSIFSQIQVIYVSGLFEEHILTGLKTLNPSSVHQLCWWLYHRGFGAHFFLPWQAPKSVPVTRRAVPATSDSQGINSVFHLSIHSSYCEQRQEIGATSPCVLILPMLQRHYLQDRWVSEVEKMLESVLFPCPNKWSTGTLLYLCGLVC